MPHQRTARKIESPRRKQAATTANVFLALAFLAVILKGVVDLGAGPPPPEESTLQRALPDAVRFEKHPDPFPHYLAYGGSGNVIGAVVLTDDCPPPVKGYMGVIHQAVGVTDRGVMAGIVPYSHNETPYYMDMVLDSGLPADLSEVDLKTTYPDPDTISGATVSSRAIIRDARAAAIIAARSLFGVETVEPERDPSVGPVPWRAILLACCLILSLVAGRFGSPRWLREATIVLNLLVVGILVNSPLTLSVSSRLMVFNFPGWGSTYLILILLYLLVSIPLSGRSYCRLVCPFGALQHLADRCCPWKITPGAAVVSLLPPFRKALLALLLTLAVPLGMSGFSQIEPFYALFSFRMTTLVWIFVTVVIIVSLFWRRFWCNAFCPTGTLLALLSRLIRPVKGKFDESI